MARLRSDIIVERFKDFLSARHTIDSDATSFIFYDFDKIDERLTNIREAFPEGTLHAVAIKANPLLPVLKFIVDRGFGLEAASFPEIALAIKAGAKPEHIVFDSPAKTLSEIKYALDNGIYLNADNLGELDRISTLIDSGTDPRPNSIGLRINPQIGKGSISETSVAGAYSKFGVPLSECRDEIFKAYQKHSWLSGIHSHIGSQGMPLDMLVSGAETLTNLIEEINSLLQPVGRKLSTIDIGGGFPVDYGKDKPPTIKEYGHSLQKLAVLMDSEVQLITEFGRYVSANSGWTATRVEYVKRESRGKTLMVHVGADMFLRECYQPDNWYHEFILCDPAGNLKSGKDSVEYNIAGPLCFSDDIIGRDISLPIAGEGDWVIVRDTGAYTLAMWSRYNSRQIPPIIGYGANKGMKVLRKGESPEAAIHQWVGS